MKKVGFRKVDQVISKPLLSNLQKISDKIISYEMKMRLFGVGNRSMRNSTIFTGNLILKSELFLEVLEQVTPFAKAELGENCVVSEFKLVTSFKSESFDLWWHRDFPFSDDIDKRFNSNIGLACIVPLCDFNQSNGSTLVVPGSHKFQTFPPSYKAKDYMGDGVQLESNIGDIWLYDPRVIHSGASNPSKDYRHIILAHFVIPPIAARENFKKQVGLTPYKSDFLKKERQLWNTHVPDSNKFGSNRGWEHTSFRLIIKILEHCYKGMQKSFIFLRIKIYAFLCH